MSGRNLRILAAPLFALLIGGPAAALSAAPSAPAAAGDEGGSLDPNGIRAGDEGGSLDPNGIWAGDEGGSLDPNG